MYTLNNRKDGVRLVKDQYLSIGEVSKLANISIQTLRYYDQINLFKPSYTDPNSNYRYYKDSQLYHLDLIKSLKHLGTSLDEIKHVQQQTPENLLDFLNKQEQIIENRLRKLKDVQQTLLKTKKQMQDQLAITALNEIYERFEDEERILTIKTQNLTPEYVPNSYYSSLKTTVENEGGVIPSRYGCIFPFSAYTSLEEIRYDYVFTPLMSDRYIHNISADMNVSTKRAGRYIGIAFYFEADKYFTYYEQLRHYVEQNQLSVFNEVYEIFMPTNYSPFKDDEFIVELKIRINSDIM